MAFRILKPRYEATVMIVQKGCEPLVYYKDKFRFKWAALVICLLMQVDIVELQHAGVFDIQTKIEEL